MHVFLIQGFVIRCPAGLHAEGNESSPNSPAVFLYDPVLLDLPRPWHGNFYYPLSFCSSSFFISCTLFPCPLMSLLNHFVLSHAIWLPFSNYSCSFILQLNAGDFNSGVCVKLIKQSESDCGNVYGQSDDPTFPFNEGKQVRVRISCDKFRNDDLASSVSVGESTTLFPCCY